MTPEQTAANLESMKSMVQPGVEANEISLVIPPRVTWMAIFMTWWTIILEGLIAAAFLAPNRDWISNLRNALLLTFAFSTYVVVYVLGFGVCFAAMGISQCERRQKKTILCYLTLALAMLFNFHLRT